MIMKHSLLTITYYGNIPPDNNCFKNDQKAKKRAIYINESGVQK